MLFCNENFTTFEKQNQQFNYALKTAHEIIETKYGRK